MSDIAPESAVQPAAPGEPEAAPAPAPPAAAEPATVTEVATGQTQAAEPAAVEADAAEPAAAEADHAGDAPTSDLAAPASVERGPGPAAVAKLLAERFPAVFAPGNAKPLKLKIQADIQARLDVVVSRKVMSVVLQRHTTSTAYLRAMAAATQRFDLDGQPAGELSEEHRAAAVAESERRRALFAERRAAERAAEREAQRAQQQAQRDEQRAQQQAQRDRQRQHQQAQAQAYQQREAEGAERAGLAALLRAFETTTLTRANFCALKGIAEADLDGQLARAREERAQRMAALPTPAAPRRDGPPAGGHGERASQGPRREGADLRQPRRGPRGPQPG